MKRKGREEREREATTTIMGSDYFRTLQVDRTAKEEDIRKAYHRLAIRWHPDKNPDNLGEADAKFKEICRAYAVLSDPRKRAHYEQFGEDGNDGYVPPPPPPPNYAPNYAHDGGINFLNPLEGLRERISQQERAAGGVCMGEGAASRKRSAPVTPTPKSLPCTLEDLYAGASKKLKIAKEVAVSAGKTKTIEEIITIDIKPGWKRGTKLTYPEKGLLIDNKPTDLVFTIEERPHKVFKREGNDLITIYEISLREALTGCTINLKTLDGRILTLPINSVVDPSYEEVVEGEGMPISKELSKKGDLRVRFKILFPKFLTPEQKKGFMELLPE